MELTAPWSSANPLGDGRFASPRPCPTPRAVFPAENPFNGGGKILKFTPPFTDPDNVPSTFARGLTLPRGVVFDGADNLYVSGDGVTATCRLRACRSLDCIRALEIIAVLVRLDHVASCIALPQC
jgi:hypothetical protein